MTLAYHTLDAEWIETCEKDSVLDTFKTLLFGVCFFHAQAFIGSDQSAAIWNDLQLGLEPDPLVLAFLRGLADHHDTIRRNCFCYEICRPRQTRIERDLPPFVT